MRDWIYSGELQAIKIRSAVRIHRDTLIDSLGRCGSPASNPKRVSKGIDEK